MVNNLRASVLEMHRSALGAATIVFGSSAQRTIALHSIHQLPEGYSLRFIPHNEGKNLRHIPTDRICWLMLVNYPLDGRSMSHIAMSVAGFATFLHWLDSANLAHVRASQPMAAMRAAGAYSGKPTFLRRAAKRGSLRSDASSG